MEEKKKEKEMNLDELKKTSAGAGNDGQEVYKCPNCDFTTDNYWNLQMHIVKQH